MLASLKLAYPEKTVKAEYITVNSGQSGHRLIRNSAASRRIILSLQAEFNIFYSGQSGLHGIRTVLWGPFSVRYGRRRS